MLSYGVKLERSTKPNLGIPEDRQGKVNSWPEMNHLITNCLSIDLEPRELKFARKYFRAQKLLHDGKKTKASNLFRSLDCSSDYLEFETNNRFLLRTIDIAVKGKSSQQDDY